LVFADNVRAAKSGLSGFAPALFCFVLGTLSCLPPGRAPITHPPPKGLKARIAIFPPENLSGASAPLNELQMELRAKLVARGANLVRRNDVELFLARHRLRYTGGIDSLTAKALSRELRADAVLISSLQTYDNTTPKMALTMRLVATGDVPSILWIDGFGIGGRDAPGLFGVGNVSSIAVLRRRTIGRLSFSLASYLRGYGPKAYPCPNENRFKPASAFFAPFFDPQKRKVVAVLPFQNRTRRRNSGLAVMLEFIRQLVATENIDVVDPGVTRHSLLEYRVIMQDGVAIETARLIANVSKVDAIVGGTVFDYSDGVGQPEVSFSAIMLEGQRGRVVWRLSSSHKGDDRVFFFDHGTISTASGLTCRMISNFVDSMLRKKPKLRDEGLAVTTNGFQPPRQCSRAIGARF